jgi:hypothetical protein
MPGNSGEPVVTVTAGEHFYPFLPTRLRVHWAPGIPHALFLKGRTFTSKPRAKTRGEIADFDNRIRRTPTAVIIRESG